MKITEEQRVDISKLLGVRGDSDIARQFNVSRELIRQMRAKQNIFRYRNSRRDTFLKKNGITVTPEFIADTVNLLRIFPVKWVKKTTKLSIAFIEELIYKYDIPKKPKFPVLVRFSYGEAKEILESLGTISDVDIAKKWKMLPSTVCSIRNKLHIPPKFTVWGKRIKISD
jgi:hypothetical protein